MKKYTSYARREDTGRSYVWRNGTIERWSYLSADDATHNKLLDCYVVDDYSFKTSVQRFGIFDESGWCSVPFRDFPKDFKLALLLVGWVENQ